MTIDIDQLRKALVAVQPEEVEELLDRLEAAESSAAWHQRGWMALQMHQKKMRDPERTMVCDILANGELMHTTVAGDRYAIPGAQPTQSVPVGWKLVPIEPTPEMMRALIDGANQYDSWHEGYRDMIAAAPEAKP